MSIEYVEIRSRDDREIIGIIDSAKSVIWVSRYFGVGEFEIYAKANKQNVALLHEDNYVTRPNDYSDGRYMNIGVIEHIEIANNAQDGRMIIASGRFAKSFLDRRHIYRLNGTQNTPTILSGNVEVAARSLVNDNAINCSFDSYRNIAELALGPLNNIPARIVDAQGRASRKQVSYQNLLTYSDELLEEYNLGSRVALNDETKKLEYIVFAGVDRSTENTDGNEPVVFSMEFDNLIESNFLHDTANAKTTALIGGEGEGLQRFYTLLNGAYTGLARRETWVDAASINKTYTDGEEERTYTDAEYREMLERDGEQKLAEFVETQSFDGTVNVNGGTWKLNQDYNLGDVVTVQDNEIEKYANVRIITTTEIQDDSGYTIDITYRGGN